MRKKNYYKTLGEKEKHIVVKPEYKKKKTGFLQPRNYSTLFKGNNIWIIKPSDYNRGRGIKLFNSI